MQKEMNNGIEKLLLSLLTLVVIAIIILSLTSCGPSTYVDPETGQPTVVQIEGTHIERYVDHDEHVVCYYRFHPNGIALSCVPQYGYR